MERTTQTDSGAVRRSRKHVQIVASIIACMPILSYGTAMGWISPYLDQLTGTFLLTEDNVSWLASLLYFPAPLSVLLYGAAADRIGRKLALFACCLPFVIGWSMKIMWTTATGLMCARAVIGFGTGGASVVCPLYVKEISEDAIRGTTGIFIGLSITLGSLLIFILGAFLPFYPVLWLMMSIAVTNLFLLFCLPDSPSFLVERGENEKAAKALGWLRSLPADDAMVLDEVDRLIKEQGSAPPKFSPKVQHGIMILHACARQEHSKCMIENYISAEERKVADKTASKAFWIALVVGLAREFCGCLAIVVYSSDIFDAAAKSSGIAWSSNQQSIAVAAAQVLGSLLSTQIVDRAGRKPLLIASSFTAGCSMCLLGVWFVLSEGLRLPGWVPIVGLCLTIFADAAGLQPLPYVIMTEMFSFQIRGTVATIILIISFLADFAILKIYSQVIGWIGYQYTFFAFAIIVFLYLFFVVYFVPETKKKSLDEIYAELNGFKRHSSEKNKL